jgi:surfeit locus 1 family protein
MPGWLPFLIGAVLVVQFAGLGSWQVSRGLEKRAQQQMFSDETIYTDWSDGLTIRPYQRIQASGIFDTDHQILLENIIVNSRLGYYVLTALDPGDDAPLLLINRGWLEKTGDNIDPATIAVDSGRVTVRGRAGSLPKAGYKMGAAITAGSSWPQKAVYPTLDELAVALERDVQPFVLLMEPQEAQGFYRHWVPEEMGPGRHFAYALQWFAMGAVLAALLIWNYRRQRTGNV